jgi:hypothetical protein
MYQKLLKHSPEALSEIWNLLLQKYKNSNNYFNWIEMDTHLYYSFVKLGVHDRDANW